MILSSFGVTVPAVPNTELHAVLREAFVKLDPIQAHEGMVRVLKRTRNLLPLSALVDQLPLSLQTAAFSVPLRKADHERLVAAVNAPLEGRHGVGLNACIILIFAESNSNSCASEKWLQFSKKPVFARSSSPFRDVLGGLNRGT